MSKVKLLEAAGPQLRLGRSEGSYADWEWDGAALGLGGPLKWGGGAAIASSDELVTAAELTSALASYVTDGELATTLSSYVTSAALSTALNDYVATDAVGGLSIDWGQLGNVPDTATRWPTWSEVTSKPTTFPVDLTAAYSWTGRHTFADHVGVGTADVEAWPGTFVAMEFGGSGAIMHASRTAAHNFHVANNAFFDGAWKHKSTNPALLYQLNVTGTHSWSTAPSGTIDTAATFTERLRVSSEGVRVVNGALYFPDGTSMSTASVGSSVNQAAAYNWTGLHNFGAGARSQGGTFGSGGFSGLGLESGTLGSSYAFLQSYNRTTNAFAPLNLYASEFAVYRGAVLSVFVDATNGALAARSFTQVTGDMVLNVGGGGNAMVFQSQATERWRMDTNGNFGLATADVEAWTDVVGIEGPGGGALGLHRTVPGAYLFANTYYASGWKYKTTAAASQAFVSTAGFAVNVAASGTADTAPTWATAFKVSPGNQAGQVQFHGQSALAWYYGYMPLEGYGWTIAGQRGEVDAQGGHLVLASNYHFNAAGSELTQRAGKATMYEQFRGNHFWKVSTTAPAAGAGIAWATVLRSASVTELYAVTIYAAADNTYQLGHSTLRWSSVWSANGTIQTSARHFKNVGEQQTPEQGLAAILALQIYEGEYKNQPGVRRLFPVLDETPEYLRPNGDGESWVLDNPLYANVLATQALDARLQRVERHLALA